MTSGQVLVPIAGLVFFLATSCLDDSLDILPAIKHLRPNPGLRCLLPEHISRIEEVEGGRAQRVLESS